jgi:hypothetical protein
MYECTPAANSLHFTSGGCAVNGTFQSPTDSLPTVLITPHTASSAAASNSSSSSVASYLETYHKHEQQAL